MEQQLPFSHLATRDIMAALKATVLCVPGSRGEGEEVEEEEVGVERVLEEQCILYLETTL